jgi:hypothetical protein
MTLSSIADLQTWHCGHAAPGSDRNTRAAVQGAARSHEGTLVGHHKKPAMALNVKAIDRLMPRSVIHFGAMRNVNDLPNAAIQGVAPVNDIIRTSLERLANKRKTDYFH